MDRLVCGLNKELIYIQAYIADMTIDEIKQADDFYIYKIADKLLKKQDFFYDEDFMDEDMKEFCFENDVEIPIFKVINNEENYINKTKLQNVIVDDILFYEDAYNLDMFLPDKEFDEMIDFYYDYFIDNNCGDRILELMQGINRYAISLSLLTEEQLDINKYYYALNILSTLEPIYGEEKPEIIKQLEKK